MSESYKCPECGQNDFGQMGEYACKKCGVPTTWDIGTKNPQIKEAAPLMLEALKKITAKCSELDYPDCCIISKIAQAAIDAAEGKE